MITLASLQASGTLFDHIPAQIIGVLLGVALTAIIGMIVRQNTLATRLSERITTIEAELVHLLNSHKGDKEQAEDLMERMEKHMDAMESRLELQIKEMSADVKALVREMHSEFMGCPGHRASRVTQG